MDLKDHPLYTTTRVVKDGIKALESEMQSGSTLGNRILATNNKIYIQDKLNLWIKENADNPKYKTIQDYFKMILKKNT